MAEAFHRERLNAVMVKGKRFYTTPDGRMLPSVTTMLGVLPKAALENWKLKTVAEFAVSQVNEWAKPDGQGGVVLRMPHEATVDTIKKGPGWDSRARDAGEIVHKIFEDVSLGRDPYVPEGYERAVSYAQQFVEEFEVELVAAEPQLINYSLGYAGSADLIARLTLPNGERVLSIVDYKSGSGLYGSTAYQCAAYARAETWIDGSAGNEEKDIDASIGLITHCFGLWVRKSGWALYELTNDYNVWQVIEAAHTIFEKTNDDWKYRSQYGVNRNPIKSAGPNWY